MRRRNLVINGVLGAGVITVGLLAYFTIDDSSTATTAASRTTTVGMGTVTATVAGSGNVTSAVNKSLTFSGCSGKLTSVLVSSGDKVTVGQRLATVDTTDAGEDLQTAQLNYDAAQTSRQNALDQAQTQVTNAQSTYDTDAAKVTTAQNAVTAAQTAYDNATAKDKSQKLSQLTNAQNQLSSAQSALSKDQDSITSAQTSLDQAQAASSQSAMAVRTAQIALTQARTNLSGCTLLAPSAGMITAVNDAVGDAVTGSSSGTSSSGSSSSGSTSGSTTGTSSDSTTASSGFITMVDMSKLEIDTTFSESDIASIKKGQTASVLFAALTSSTSTSGTTVAGKVSHVDATSTVSSSVVTYGVTISLVSPPAALRLGQTGTVTVTTATKTGVLYVLTSAITTAGRQKTVTVRDNGVTSTKVVTTGVVGDSTTEILTGLAEGETIVLPATTNSSTSTTSGGIPGGGGFGGGGLGGGGVGGVGGR